MVLLIIIPIKWLFHWGYTLFSDKPILQMASRSRKWQHFFFRAHEIEMVEVEADHQRETWLCDHIWCLVV